MPRFRQPAPLKRAPLAAVDLPAVVERAEVDDKPAPRAGNPYERLDTIHARTPTAALIEVAPPVRLRAPSPGCVHARHEGSGLYTWAFIYFAVIDRYETP